MARDGNVEDDERLSVHVKEDVAALISNTGGNFDRLQDDRRGSVVSPVSTSLAALLCQLSLPNTFAVAFWFPACEVFVRPSCIACSSSALKAILVRSACEFEAQYSFGLWQVEVSAP